VRFRRDKSPVIVDVGGGYGGGVTLRLEDNDIRPTPFNGANQSTEETKDRQLEFANNAPRRGGNSAKRSTLTSRTAPQSRCLPILNYGPISRLNEDAGQAFRCDVNGPIRNRVPE
jgi:hypothetical protein